MKKLFVFLTVIMLAYNATSQAPQKMSYQCVVRNTSGGLIMDQSVGIKISILQGSASGTLIFQETYSPNPQTNANGLLSVEIGGGTPVTGTFSTIDWSTGPYFLKTETDPAGGTNYTISGTSQLLSVPYALYAKSSGTSSDAVTITGTQTITGIKTFSNDLLINGLTVGKGKSAESSNTAVGLSALYNNTAGYSNTAEGEKALYSNTEGIYNTANGSLALYTNSTGNFNTAVGNQSLYFNSTGSGNTAVGMAVLYNNTTGISNTAHGTSALYFNTTGNSNVAIGEGSLYNNTTGNFNTANGFYALFFNTEGYDNTANGAYSLYKNKTGSSNTASGRNSLMNNTTGTGNTVNGYQAFRNNTTGAGNTAIGTESGFNNMTGNNNVFLGSSAGYYETGSNKLFIDNSPRANEADARIKSLIYGVFNADPANQVLTINGKVGIGTINPGAKFEVVGSATINGTLNMQNQNISNLADPQNLQDAVTMAYIYKLKEAIYNEMLLAGLNGVLFDRDGNAYKTIRIGTQVWMAENLKTTKLRDGTRIPLVTDNNAWNALTSAGRCYLDNDSLTNKNIYGAIYNGYTVSSGNLCPTGWHVPSNMEWVTLGFYLGGDIAAGGKLKETGLAHWVSPNAEATNETGFTALPGGIRSSLGVFNQFGQYGYWWTSTLANGIATYRYIAWNTGNLYGNSTIEKYGFSVRCLRDN